MPYYCYYFCGSGLHSLKSATLQHVLHELTNTPNQISRSLLKVYELSIGIVILLPRALLSLLRGLSLLFAAIIVIIIIIGITTVIIVDIIIINDLVIAAC